jgi:hypothetical protein
MDIKQNKRKYVLYSADDGRPDSLKQCAFFSSPAGCKNGSTCKFMHGEAIGFTKEPVESRAINSLGSSKQHRLENGSSAASNRPKADIPHSVANNTVRQEKEHNVAASTREQHKRDHAELGLAKSSTTGAPPGLRDTGTKPNPTTQQPMKTPPASNGNASLANIEQQMIKKLQEQQLMYEQRLAKLAEQLTSNTGSSTMAAVVPQSTSALVPGRPNESDDDNDTDFLFKAVNVALDATKKDTQHSPSDKPQQQQQQQRGAVPVDAIDRSTWGNNGDTSPVASLFVGRANVSKALQTSNSKHAVDGSSKKRIFANQKIEQQEKKLVVDSVDLCETEFDPKKINFESLSWQTLVDKSQSHFRFGKEYGFVTDERWVQPKPFGDWYAAFSLLILI